MISLHLWLLGLLLLGLLLVEEDLLTFLLLLLGDLSPDLLADKVVLEHILVLAEVHASLDLFLELGRLGPRLLSLPLVPIDLLDHVLLVYTQRSERRQGSTYLRRLRFRTPR